MVKKFLFATALFLFFMPGQAQAIENPLARPNNKIGIHILAATELEQAAKLVNSNGGDWGYVTIPIQATDRDTSKWQHFMDQCKRYHIIPLVRLATSSDPANKTVWRKTTPDDIVYFANFLNTLAWPTKNRYVIISNEVNRADEWGGTINPSEYAEVLNAAVTVFKSKSPDYFIISAGLDNAAPNKGTEFMNQYDFMRAMQGAIPGIFNQIDGISSHSYPNPGFSQPPNATSLTGVGSFRYERELAKSLSGKDLPVFITETGWDNHAVSEDQIMQYYHETFDTIWNDANIVAVTPFVLGANMGPFQKFSFIHPEGVTKQYDALAQLPKTKGFPLLPIKKVLAAETEKGSAPTKAQDKEDMPERKIGFLLTVKNFFAWAKEVW